MPEAGGSAGAARSPAGESDVASLGPKGVAPVAPGSTPSGLGSSRGSGEGLVRNVVLVSIDTCRADRLGAWGYPKPTSINLDAVCGRSVQFRRAQAQSAQTAPSHAALFTSLYGGTHGIVNVHGSSAEMPTLPAGVVTLAEGARKGGLQTAAFVSGGNLTKGMGMDRGFETWDERNEDVSGRVDSLLGWLEAHGREPFVALLHTYQVHAPYVPPKQFAERFVDASYDGPLRATYERYLGLSAEEAFRLGAGPDYWPASMLDYTDADVRFLSDLYDGEIAYVDSQLRRLLEVLLKAPYADTTAIVILADHGEEFRDHGRFQHDEVYEELVHVPLLVKLPTPLERKGWSGPVETPVELVDVAPTIVELLGLPSPGELWVGRSLTGLLDGATRPAAEKAEERPRFSRLTRDPGPQTYACVTWRGWKYIRRHQQDKDITWEQLFDLRSDPGEKNDLSKSDDPAVVSVRDNLKKALRSHEQREAAMITLVGAAGTGTIDDAKRAELQGLGYTGTEQPGH